MNLEKTEMLHGLYGSQVIRSKCVGYCYYHKCHLTAKTLKGHKCLAKQCNCLKKHEGHDFWRQREEIKSIKKEKKNHYKM